MLTVTEAARHLRISNRTVYRLIETGQIGAVRVGKQWRIRPDELPGTPRMHDGANSVAPAGRLS